MPNTFKSNGAAVTTSNVTAYTCPAATQTTIIGLSLANTSASEISVTVELLKSGVTVYALVSAAPVPVGSSLVVVGGDQRVVMQATDTLRARTASGTADLVLSYLEIT
jgi:hypothetical protein